MDKLFNDQCSTCSPLHFTLSVASTSVLCPHITQLEYKYDWLSQRMRPVPLKGKQNSAFAKQGHQREWRLMVQVNKNSIDIISDNMQKQMRSNEVNNKTEISVSGKRANNNKRIWKFGPKFIQHRIKCCKIHEVQGEKKMLKRISRRNKIDGGGQAESRGTSVGLLGSGPGEWARKDHALLCTKWLYTRRLPVANRPMTQ